MFLRDLRESKESYLLVKNLLRAGVQRIAVILLVAEQMTELSRPLSKVSLLMKLQIYLFR